MLKWQDNGTNYWNWDRKSNTIFISSYAFRGWKHEKPTLFHGIRVGIYLYTNGYSQDIVIAGFLHDIFEDTSVKEEELIHHFGVEVTRLVSACTKDRKIKDSDERIEELIQRCAQQGENALIVKTADILDSFSYYTKKTI